MVCEWAPKHYLAIFAIVSLAGLISTVVVEPAAARPAKRDEFVEFRPAGMPALMAIVSLSDQHVTIYDAHGPILRAPVSSGQTGYETPVGIYSVLQKEAEHYSNRYDDASMPFMQRITWSGIALHAGTLPGYPASHGCIRMPYGFAERLFDMTKIGMRVIVARNDAAPATISHPLLFPKPSSSGVASLTQGNHNDPAKPTLRSIAAARLAEADAAEKKANEARLAVRRKTIERAKAMKARRVAEFAKTRAAAQMAEAERAIATAISPEALQQANNMKANAATTSVEAEAQLEAASIEVQSKTDAAAQATDQAKAAEAAKVIALDAAREAKRKLSPVSIFISLKTQRLYVRQAFQPLLESPVAIRDADKAIGTHIYTALEYANAAADLRWSVVTIGGKPPKREPGSNRSQRGEDRVANPVSINLATTALDRVTIPQDVIDRIWEVVSPGSSLIVSDEDISKETGQATDFVILIGGEPQGGLKNRPRRTEGYYSYNYRYNRSSRRSPYGLAPFGWW
jgi:L,D-transpeptidase catalytic domain